MSMQMIFFCNKLNEIYIFSGYVFVCSYVLSFSLGAGPVPALLLPEIFASRIRAKAVALSLGVHWVSLRLETVVPFLLLTVYVSLLFFFLGGGGGWGVGKE